MKKMKKILAMLLALTMVLGMGLTVMANDGADGVVGTYDDTGMIEVKGIDDTSANLSVKAYKIIEAKYDSNGNFNGYRVLYDLEDDIVLSEVDQFGQVLVKQSQLNEVIAASKVASEESVTLSNGETYKYKREYDLNKEDEYFRAEVQVGTYLVMITGAEGAIYNPLVISVNYINKDGENFIYDGAVGVEEIYGVVAGEAWVKKSNLPIFTKVEYDIKGIKTGEGNVDEVEGLGYGNSVNVGSPVEYTLTIKQIPFYGGDHPVFNVVDNMADGLDYVNNSLTVEVLDEAGARVTSLEKDKDYKLTEENHKITVDFVLVDNSTGVKTYALNNYQAKTVVIKYQANLNKKASYIDKTITDYETAANENEATLNYTIDSKVSDSTKEKQLIESTYTYTFDLTDLLLKTGEGDEAEGLPGATFGLYTDEDCTKPYENSFAVEGKEGEYVTNTAGNLEIKGIEAGTYYLKEIKAPIGYSVNTHVYKIEVIAAYNTEETSQKDDGILVSWEMKVDGTATTELKIPNTKLVSLPSTGGIGTTIFTVAGCGIMIAAAFFFFASRKKEN